MKNPRKIRILYFDDSTNMLISFINFCNQNDIIELVGAFSSLNAMTPILEQNGYLFFNLFACDVAVVHMENCNIDSISCLQNLKKQASVKLIGLLSKACIHNQSILSCFDYYSEVAGADNLMTEKYVYTRLLYQIKSARLMRNNENAGINGTWAVLPHPTKPIRTQQFNIIAIGASTGGTEALSQILSALPCDLPPIIVVQHILDNFTDFFAYNLSARTDMKITVAHGGERLEKGNVYIAGDGKQLEIYCNNNGEYYTRCTSSEKISGHCPSVDVLFSSVAKAAGASAIGIILTGMGTDGAQGLLEMHKKGAYTIGQDQKSSVVYGMPMAAYTIGAISKQLPLNSISKAILSAVKNEEREERKNE